jgi:hypothetical protein
VELEKARRALDKYELVLGPNPDAAGDITALAQRLEAADKDKAALQLQLGEAEAVSWPRYHNPLPPADVVGDERSLHRSRGSVQALGSLGAYRVVQGV